MRLTVAVSTGLIACLANGGHAQQSRAPQSPTFGSEITLIKVDVSVLDPDGQPVRGLAVTDFTILEGGVPQEIQTFTAIDVPSPPEGSAPWMREVSPDVKGNVAATDHRLMVIVLDDAQIRMQMTRRVKETARLLVDGLGPGDQAAIVFTKNNRGAQDFTDDHARLLAAVDTFSGGFSPGMAAYFNRSSVRALETVAKSLGEIPQRRKAIVYVSVGVPLDPGARSMSTLFSDMVDVFREAQRANVNIYSVDPSGLGELDNEELTSGQGGFALSRGLAALNRDFLRTVADNTGGLAIVERNDFRPGVAQILRDTGSYYVLGYVPPNAKADGKLRKIAVKVGRPGLTVRARSGHYGSPEAKPAKGAPPSELDRARDGLLPKADLRMEVFAAPFALPGRREAAVALVLALRQPAPQGNPELREQLDLNISAFGPEGALKASKRETLNFTLRSDDDEVAYELLSEMDLKPGRYQLRCAARSAAEGKAGSVFYDLEVPDFSKATVSLSGLILSATPGLPVSPRDRLAKLMPIVATTLRRFTTSTRVEAFVRVYQNDRGPSPVALAVSVSNGQGAAVFDAQETLSADRFDVNRAADYRLELPISRLAPGPYLLSIEAKGSERSSARRAVPFSVD